MIDKRVIEQVVQEQKLELQGYAEENLKSKSLKASMEKHAGLHAVRFSMAPYREQDWLTNYPLYAVQAL